MYKVIIVDDEPIIVEGLKIGIEWSKYDCEIVGTASNGLEGLDLVKKLQPNIVFSDISMTNMDGLTMIAAIKSEYPNTEVCLLTGYRNFEYAQQAVKLGVSRFLLKPSKIDEIEEAIQAMIDSLKAKGQLGEQIVDNIWNINDEKERYIYNTFIKDRPEVDENEDGKLSYTDANNFILKNAIMYMYDHYVEKMSLLDVAEQCYVSSWHLSKLLNQYTGKGFFEIINVIRIDKAKELLKTTSLKIQDISEKVGFSDVAHFSRLFKNHLGMSPKEYRTSDVNNN